jgi:hypothetical protein
MIELNCTYKESKKILELGYDFSKVCNSWGNGTGKVFLGQIDSFTSDALFYEITPENKIIVLDFVTEYKPTDSITPIIPKAALEACLPDYKGYDNDSVINYTWAGHTSTRSVCFIPEWNRFTSAISIDEYLTKHQSAFEAFLWVHENYPEELKKKFDEVMG